jgi:saccharopine dehydrogenase (NADP+, L-glutamate forming)/spermidine synthase
VLILNELGLDPGIDHMEAMRIIHKSRSQGGIIESFTSYCGGLPAREANNNPFGYKFSWSPMGVLLAGKNSARYFKDGQVVFVPAESLFDQYSMIPIPGLGDFEGYPNRDSVSYRETYGILEARSVLRGTLRYPGWCQTMKKMIELGLLDQIEKDWTGVTWQGLVRRLINNPYEQNIKKAVGAFLNCDPESEVIARMEWLGLFDEEPLPIQKGSALDSLALKMTERLRYAPGERDMVILQHEFLVVYPGQKREKIVSTLIDFGIPNGYSAMSRTVGLPVAIGAKLILEGRINMTGVEIPVHPVLYEPILEELEALGISFREESEFL